MEGAVEGAAEPAISPSAVFVVGDVHNHTRAIWLGCDHVARAIGLPAVRVRAHRMRAQHWAVAAHPAQQLPGTLGELEAKGLHPHASSLHGPSHGWSPVSGGQI